MLRFRLCWNISMKYNELINVNALRLVIGLLQTKLSNGLICSLESILSCQGASCSCSFSFSRQFLHRQINHEIEEKL